MSELEVPNEFKGQWDHALILTYGFHVSFFEHGLWKQLDGVRNKVVLADGRRYLESCIQCADGDLPKRLNHQYVAGGIFSSNAAHAKVILLANSEEGRLLVGSGNLGLPGYASGGELFTKYEYAPGVEDELGAFVAVREIVEAIIERGYVDPLPRRRLRFLLEAVPWLFRSPPRNGGRTVRHNMVRSHLDQLAEAVGSDPVKELWIMSPFYDRDASALDKLVGTLKPRRAVVLVQRDYTSVDPDALLRAMKRHPEVEVRPFTHKAHGVDVHAKLYLAKLKTRSVCLQGSPNLSRAAMLNVDPAGNIEVANLLIGRRDEFDDILDALAIEPAAKDISSLALSFEPIEPPAEGVPETWCLTGGEWRGPDLWLDFRGEIPDPKGAEVNMGEEPFACRVHEQTSHRLHLKLPKEAQALLTRPTPVTLRWRAGAVSSNPVYVCNLEALDASMSAADSSDKLSHVGDLSLDDVELEDLLLQLEKTLILDRRDIWRLAGKAAPDVDEEAMTDDELRIDYADVDYEALRRHPKLQQYSVGDRGSPGYERSRLQIILSGITQHFNQQLLTTALEEAARLTAEQGVAVEEDLESDEEIDEVRERRRQSAEQRVRRILKNFIRRYLRGIRSRDFQELVGYEVMVQNYIIFSHVLWRLLVTERLDAEYVIESLLNIWAFLWGSPKEAGYIATLGEEDEQRLARKWLREYHADSTLLAGLYYSATLAYDEEWDDIRFGLRDLVRSFLERGTLDPSPTVLEEARDLCSEIYVQDPPSATEIVEEMAALANFDTEESLLERLALTYGYKKESMSFEKPSVVRQPAGRSVPVDCLTIHASAPTLTRDVAASILREWMLFEPDLDYFRIAMVGGGLLVYDVTAAEAWWLANRQSDIEELGRVVAVTELEPILAKLRRRAAKLDKEKGFAAEKAVG